MPEEQQGQVPRIPEDALDVPEESIADMRAGSQRAVSRDYGIDQRTMGRFLQHPVQLDSAAIERLRQALQETPIIPASRPRAIRPRTEAELREACQELAGRGWTDPQLGVYRGRVREAWVRSLLPTAASQTRELDHLIEQLNREMRIADPPYGRTPDEELLRADMLRRGLGPNMVESILADPQSRAEAEERYVQRALEPEPERSAVSIQRTIQSEPVPVSIQRTVQSASEIVMAQLWEALGVEAEPDMVGSEWKTVKWKQIGIDPAAEPEPERSALDMLLDDELGADE